MSVHSSKSAVIALMYSSCMMSSPFTGARTRTRVPDHFTTKPNYLTIRNTFQFQTNVRYIKNIHCVQSNKTDIRKGTGAIMPVWLVIIVANAVISLACYARAVYKAYKAAEIALEEAKHTIQILESELRIARGNQTPDFLLADDPMDALLNEVGKARK